MLRHHRKTLPSRQAIFKTCSKQSLAKLLNTCETARLSKKKQQVLNNKGCDSNKTHKVEEKQNCRLRQNTPKMEQIDREDSNEGLDQFSQIKFISKQCSSIKGNLQDNNSSSTSHNHIDDFSPLFDRTDSKNSKDDFLLSIERVHETQIFSEMGKLVKSRPFSTQRRNSYISKEKCSINKPVPLFRQKQVQFPNQSVLVNVDSLCYKTNHSGKIRKNKIAKQTNNLVNSSAQKSMDWIEKQICDIFLGLNCKNAKQLSKDNCNSENLSTQLSYLIGSILTKIKVKGQLYNFKSFSSEFKILIQGLEKQQLEHIFASNRNKFSNESKISIVDIQISPVDPQKQISFQASPTFQNNEKISSFPFQKIHKINDKLNEYLLKNRLSFKNNVMHPGYENCSEILPVQKPMTCVRKQQQICKDENIPLNFSETISFTDIQNSKKNTSQVGSESIKIDFSLKNDCQIIKGLDGQEFSLTFTELNKHL